MERIASFLLFLLSAATFIAGIGGYIVLHAAPTVLNITPITQNLIALGVVAFCTFISTIYAVLGFILPRE